MIEVVTLSKNSNYYNCIYMYINLVNNKKYVGQTKNLYNRHIQHIKNYDNQVINNAITKYGKDNFKLFILKQDLSTQCLLNMWEFYYIDKYNTLTINGEGYNVVSGGTNRNVWETKTEEEFLEFKARMSEIKKVQNKGESNPMYGKHHTKDTKQKIRDSKLKLNTKGGRHPKAKKVVQYDKDGSFIRIWECIADVERELGIDHSNVAGCCRGKYKTSGGYIWRYAEEDER